MIQTAEYMQRKVEQTFFPVRKTEHIEGGFQIVDHTGKTLSRVSERYCLIPNKDAVTPFIEKFGYENVASVNRQANKFTYGFNIMEPVDIGEGDFVRARAFLQTSYDKTARISVLGGLDRKVCSNGMFSLLAGINFSSLHIDDVPWQQMVRGAIESCHDFNFDFWKRLRKIPLTVESKKELVMVFKPYELEETHEKYWEKSANEKKADDIQARSLRQIQFPASLNNQHNAWGLLNNVNRAIADTLTQANIRETIKLNLRLEDYLAKSLSLN